MEANIADIVKQVLSEYEKEVTSPLSFQEKEPLAYTGKEVGKAAVLTEPQCFSIRNYQIPELKKDEILVKMEGCRVTAADIAEFIRENRSGLSNGIGRNGTGIILKTGSDEVTDCTGVPLHCGDTVITTQKAGAYSGSFEQKDIQAQSGWFRNYLILKGGSGVYQTNGLDLESRLLAEPVIAVYKTVDRAAKVSKQIGTGKRAIVAGCTVTGLITMAVLRFFGVKEIIAIGNGNSELDNAERFGAMDVVDYKDQKGLPGVIELIRKRFGGNLPDIVFYCSDSEMGLNFAKHLTDTGKGGYLCDMGYVLSKNRRKRDFDFAAPVGERFYSDSDYKKGFQILKQIRESGIPMYRLITHRYKMEQMNEALWCAVREDGLSVAVFDR